MITDLSNPGYKFKSIDLIIQVEKFKFELDYEDSINFFVHSHGLILYVKLVGSSG